LRVLTASLRKELKKPLGLLIRGPPDQTIKKLKLVIEEKKPKLVISVGDEVSRNMTLGGLRPDIIVLDGKIMRKPVTLLEAHTDRTIKLRNPAGTLTEDAETKVKDALSSRSSCTLLVDGEEDLITLLFMLHAPEGSLIIYGQPLKGIVVVKVDESSRRLARKIFNSMIVKKD